MEVYTITEASNNLDDLINKVADNAVEICIKGNRGDAMLVSKREWGGITETLHLMSNPINAKALLDSINEPNEKSHCYDSIEDMLKDMESDE